MNVYYASSRNGYRRGPYRATKAEALAECSASGWVRSVSVYQMLMAKNIQWDLVDELFSTGTLHRHDGIEQVWLKTDDLNIMNRAQQALRARGRDTPWR